MAPRLVIVGYCNNDLNRYPDGSEQRLPGGAAYFAAVAASLMMDDVGLVTRVGTNFYARDLITRFPAQGLHHSERPASCSCQTYFDAEDTTARDVTLYSGASEELQPTDIPDQWLAEADIVHIGTMPPIAQTAFLLHVLNHKREERHPLTGTCLPLTTIDTEQSFLSDPGNLRAITANMQRSDIAFFNRVEANLLAQVVPAVPLAVLKRDRDGAAALSFGSPLAEAPATAVEVVDATGAGDVFAGAFLASLVRGSSLMDALRQGCETASRSIVTYGISHLLDAPSRI